MKMEAVQSFLLLCSGTVSRYDTCTVLVHDTVKTASDAGLPTSRASKLAKHAQTVRLARKRN